MGNNGSGHSRGGTIGDLNSLGGGQPLQFHETHGDNIQLSHDKTRARRAESFCKGICFSARPIGINEKVYIRFVETNTSWSGVLRFGFTSIDPATIRGVDLPRYACPDLTNKPGNWAKALGERYTTSNIVLFFYVTRSGDVYYGVNGEEKGLFFSGVNTSSPLWAMLDIYGNTVGVEFTQANGFNAWAGDSVPHSAPISIEQELFSFRQTVSMNDSTMYPVPVVKYHARFVFSPLYLHTLCGRNARVSADRTVAIRLREEYCNAYVFTSRPVNPGQKIVIQILGVDCSYIGGLGFGLTACDPASLTSSIMPDDADLLLDRPEYWVVNKDVCRSPDVGDELSFAITEEGEVLYSRNNGKAAVLMHVDRTLPLWAFFDIYGNVQKIKVIGVTTVQSPPPHMTRSQSASGFSNHLGTSQAHQPTNLPPRPSVPTLPPPLQPQVLRSWSVPNPSATAPKVLSSPGNQHGQRAQAVSLPSSPVGVSPGDGFIPLEEARDECTVCCEKGVNSVLYTCGHMCMCFECAHAVKQDKGGLCPICRQPIKDVIKIYRS
ncbi:protein neuralized-like isoform X2 [Pomacea canaliculata]|uniref:protein neuralized-like isoform X2 n=1 Tax=Pomacea canaliculata TaxID=400727 RepID=UPI000D72602C|nr:protein neuralized-like isoform X2 [Pomacea canaliculata]